MNKTVKTFKMMTNPDFDGYKLKKVFPYDEHST